MGNDTLKQRAKAPKYLLTSLYGLLISTEYIVTLEKGVVGRRIRVGLY